MKTQMSLKSFLPVVEAILLACAADAARLSDVLANGAPDADCHFTNGFQTRRLFFNIKNSYRARLDRV